MKSNGEEGAYLSFRNKSNNEQFPRGPFKLKGNNIEWQMQSPGNTMGDNSVSTHIFVD